MKVPHPGQLCGWCNKPVIKHSHAIEEMVPIPGDELGRLRKQLYHRKRCWSKEVRQRLDLKRAEQRREDGVEELRRVAIEVAGEKQVACAEGEAVRLVRQIAVKDPTLAGARDVEVGVTPERDDVTPECRMCGQPHLTVDHKQGQIRKAIPGGTAGPRVGLLDKIEKYLRASTGWFRLEQLSAYIAGEGITTSHESVRAGMWIVRHKRHVALDERRVGNMREYRLAGSVEAAPPPLEHRAPKVERPQRIRHSNRPGPWEKSAMKQEQDVLAGTLTIPAFREAVGLGPGVEKETVMAVNGREPEMSERVRQALFILKSEKLLNELERTMISLVQDAIKSARQEIAKLVEEGNQ